MQKVDISRRKNSTTQPAHQKAIELSHASLTTQLPRTLPYPFPLLKSQKEYLHTYNLWLHFFLSRIKPVIIYIISPVGNYV